MLWDLRRFAFVGLALSVGAAACGTPNDPSAPPRVASSSSAGGMGDGGTAEVASSSSTTGSGGGSETAGTGGAPTYSINGSFPSWHAPLVKASLFFAPYDDAESRVLAELGRATKSLRLAFFNIRLDKIKSLLAAKVNAGIDVHVVLDKKQQDQAYNTMFEDLQAVGVPVTLVENTSAADATVHDKFSIIDGERVLSGSANYSYTALNVSDEALLLLENSDIAERFATEFDELVANGSDKSAPYTTEKVRSFMGPEDSLVSKLVDAIDAAKDTVVVAMFDMNTSALVNALIAAKQRGVNVVVVLDKKQADDAFGIADEALVSAGVPVVLALNTGSSQAEMHSKYMVVDHSLTFVGSNNWTNLGSYYNDENLIVIDDAMLAARAEGNFAQLLVAYKADLASLGFSDDPVELKLTVSNVKLGEGVVLRMTSGKDGPFANPVPLTGKEIILKVPGGTRIDYSYDLAVGDQQLAVELGGKKLAHTFTMPFGTGPQMVTDAFLE